MFQSLSLPDLRITGGFETFEEGKASSTQMTADFDQMLKEGQELLSY